MVVWALRAFWLPFVQQVGSEPKRFAVVTTPKATNPNLAAQAGVFTLDRGAQKGIGFAKALEGALGATLPTFESAMMPIFGFTTPLLPFMYRFTLPHSEAGRLLRVLSLEGVSAAAVYPGHKGVADSLWERRHHRP
jgi:hypothetical protein